MTNKDLIDYIAVGSAVVAAFFGSWGAVKRTPLTADMISIGASWQSIVGTGAAIVAAIAGVAHLWL